MGLLNNIKKMFRKGKMNMGLGKTLVAITDHELINIDPKELERINKAFSYYRDDKKNIEFYNSNNHKTKRKQKSLSVTKQITQKLASLTINEGVTVSIQPSGVKLSKDVQGDNELDTFIKLVLAENSFNQLYEEYLEMGIAAGGFAIRPYVQNNKIRLAWIRADQFIPLESNTDRINSAVITSKRTVSEQGDVIYYTLLEFHVYDEVTKSETVTYEVYRSEDIGRVGAQVPLSKWDEGLSEQIVFNDLSRPTFAYFKTPSRNNKNVESPLGVGIVENSYDTIDSLNMTYDQYDREIKLAKRKVVVPAQMLQPAVIQDGDGDVLSGVQFDEDEDVFMGLTETPNNNNFGITSIESSLRVPQYTAALTSMFHLLENQVGLSQGTLTNDAKVADKTATEVVSDNSQTYRTRSSIVTQVEKQLYGLIRTIIEMASKPELFDGQAALVSYDHINNPIDINLHFEDGVFVDKDKQAQQEMVFVQARLMPKSEFLKRNMELSDDDAEAWLRLIDLENAGSDEPTHTLGGDDE